ncbi:MAG: class I SAM-dependent methyltransferase [Nitrospirota bacterium]
MITWALQNYFQKVYKLLEIGVGTAFVLSGIESISHDLQLFGSDIIEGLFYAAGRLNRAELFQMDARRIPFENEFDVIGAFDVIEHIEEDGIVLSQMFKATCPGGGIILTVPQHKFLWSTVDEYARHVRRYSARELKIKCEQAGFKVIRTTSFVSFLFPAMALSSLRKKKSVNNIMAEFCIIRKLNSLFKWVFNVERRFIRMGFSFPFGGSLLIIARKN